MSTYHHATATILQQLSLCNNHHHAHIVIDKLEKDPQLPTNLR
jgi:hypothetical protein